MRIARSLARFAAALLAVVSLLGSPGTAAAWEAREGRLSDGTLWRAVVPDAWNGTLLLDLDFAGMPNRGGGPAEVDRTLSPFKAWALERGFALGGIQREPVGYDFGRAVDHLVTVHDAASSTWGRPVRTVALGGSRGAFVARLAVERRPEIFAGAVVWAGVEKLAVGSVSWNHGIDYARSLRRSGCADMVRALYREAGLDLERDLRTLARAPRIAADPAAVARAERMVSYHGRIGGPVVNVDDFDPVDPASSKLAYVDTLRRAGREADFRLLWVARAGHGSQTALERATALSMLLRRLDSGGWSATSAEAANDLAAELAKSAPAGFGDAKFREHAPVPPLRTWDAANWGTYVPPRVPAATGAGR